MSPSNWKFFVCLAALAMFAGCSGSGSGLDTEPVSGTVTLDGVAVEGAAVSFSPKSADGKAAVGRTDASGEFTLLTDGEDAGALAGSYGVTVTKTSGSDSGGAPPSLSYDQMTPEQLAEASKQAQVEMSGGGGNDIKDLLPAKYKLVNTSGLTVEVPAGGNDSVTLKLTSD